MFMPSCRQTSEKVYSVYINIAQNGLKTGNHTLEQMHLCVYNALAQMLTHPPAYKLNAELLSTVWISPQNGQSSSS